MTTAVLAGRVARCACGTERPSDPGLAFFEYLGDGSREAVGSCKHCGYHQVAHEQEQTRTRINVVVRGMCPGFEPRGDRSHDRFYCGCRGFD